MSASAAHPLVARILSIADDVFVIAPNDLAQEIRENTYLVAASQEEKHPAATHEVVGAVLAVAARRRQVVGAKGHGRASTFYVWHDAQAGQLRLSTCSCSETELPFSGEVEIGVPLESVVSAFLAAPSGIPRSELTDSYDDDANAERPLAVFVERLTS